MPRTLDRITSLLLLVVGTASCELGPVGPWGPTCNIIDGVEQCEEPRRIQNPILVITFSARGFTSEYPSGYYRFDLLSPAGVVQTRHWIHSSADSVVWNTTHGPMILAYVGLTDEDRGGESTTFVCTTPVPQRQVALLDDSTEYQHFPMTCGPRP